MSNEEKSKDALRKYASDLLALETHFQKAIIQQKTSKNVRDEDVTELLHELDRMSSNHVNELEKHLDGKEGSRVEELKSKIASFTGSVVGLIDRARTDTVSKMLRDDYTALSMITIGYTMLHTHALARENSELAELAQNHMMNCTSMIKEVSKVVPLVVAREFTDDYELAEEIGRKALDNTQHAWSGEVVNSEPEIV